MIEEHGRLQAMGSIQHLFAGFPTKSSIPKSLSGVNYIKEAAHKEEITTYMFQTFRRTRGTSGIEERG